MQSNVLKELKEIGWFALLVITGVSAMAAESPVFRPSTVSIQNSTISFRFDAESGLVDRFKLESAAGLDESAQWTTVSGSSVTEQMAGLYEVSASLETN